MTHPKVLTSHLARQAVIYIRQSTVYQTQHHVESQKRQYQLVDRAQALGWAANQCVVIDEDQGRSARESRHRTGYQRLVSMLALREVGLVLSLEVSRLARNNLDWYQLLELAATFDVLIGDEAGIYHPRDLNDRLLLGLKGTLSEVELHQIRARLTGGRENKAKRGELALTLPVGMDWDPISHKPQLAIDQSVRHSVAYVFQLFSQLHSIRAVRHFLYQTGLTLPFQWFDPFSVRQIGWRQPSYDALYAILTNPIYAGVYGYGRRQKQRDPLTGQVQVRHQARADWTVFLPDHHPGYITLAEFEENERILIQNGYQFPQKQGAARQGSALLQGLVFCQTCDARMRVYYQSGRAYYLCDTAHRRYGVPICTRASAQSIDAQIETLFLTVVNAQTLALSVNFDQKLQHQAAQVDQGWQERLQRLSYEADLARRRYEAVDPQNRLVAQTLETDWNERLQALAAARQRYEAQRPSAEKLTSTLDQMRAVITHLKDHWQAAHLSRSDQKALLRCVIERIDLENQAQLTRVTVHWYGGTTTSLTVPKYVFRMVQLHQHLAELARTQTDAEIAESLNRQQITTLRGNRWTANRVLDCRLKNAIPSAFTLVPALRVAGSPYRTTTEIAAEVQVDQTVVQTWYRLGLVSGKQNGPQSPLWIHWTEVAQARLSGTAAFDPRMISVRALGRQQQKPAGEVIAWAAANGHAVYRLRRGKAMAYFVLFQSDSTPH